MTDDEKNNRDLEFINEFVSEAQEFHRLIELNSDQMKFVLWIIRRKAMPTQGLGSLFG